MSRITNLTKKYYIKDNQLIKSSWLSDNGKKYYFGSSGSMLCNCSSKLKDDGGTETHYYRFNDDGSMHIGWYKDSYHTYYYDEDGKGVQGLQTIDGSTYYFYSTSYLDENSYHEIENKVYYFGEDGKSYFIIDETVNGWKTNSKGKCYVNNNRLLRNTWLFLDNKKYYFGSDGVMFSNKSSKLKDDGGTEYHYYYFNDDGSMHIGWYSSDDDTYYYNSDGIRVSGLQVINEDTYYFDTTYYTMVKNASLEQNKKVYFFGEDGKLYYTIDETVDGWKDNGKNKYYIKDGKRLISSWLTENAKTYYFDNHGKMLRNCEEIIKDATTGKNSFFIFNEDGTMHTGWYQHLDSSDKYYYDQNGKVVVGLNKIDGNYYYFDEYGEMLTNIQITKDNKRYIMGETGKADLIIDLSHDGWVINGSDAYYVTGGRLAYSQVTINKINYDFQQDHTLRLSSVPYFEDNGKAYIIDSKGKIIFVIDETVDGWKVNGNDKYYIKNNKLVISSWLTVDGKSYYVKQDLSLYKDTIQDFYEGDKKDVHKYYRFLSDGSVLKGWSLYNGEWVYADNDGHLITGMRKIGNAIYYFDDHRFMKKNYTFKFNNETYKFGNNGALVSPTYLLTDGWKSIDGKWKYVLNGIQLRSKFLTLGNNKYYFDYMGYMVCNAPYDVYNRDTNKYNLYFFDKNGCVRTGWYTYQKDKITYYLSNDGMAYCGEYKKNGQNCLMKDGVFDTNDCVIINNTLYQTDGNAKIIKKYPATNKGWVQLNHKWYYSDGTEFLNDKILNYSGHLYYFDIYSQMMTNTADYNFNDENYRNFCFSTDSNGHLICNDWSNDGDAPWLYHYSDNNGKIVTNSWQTIDNKKYYFDSYGNMVTDLAYIDSNYELFAQDGSYIGRAKLSQGWNLIGGHYYYIVSSSLAKGWRKIGSAYYYFDCDGIMVFSKISKINNDTYAFNRSGAMACSSWYKVNSSGDYCWADSSGALITGWHKFSNIWYYFGKDHLMMRTNFLVGTQMMVIGGDGTYKYAVNINPLCYSHGETFDHWNSDLYIGSKYYCFKDGVMISNRVEKDDDTAEYYNANGEQIISDGWVPDRSAYVKDRHAVQGWQQIDGKWYYFNLSKYKSCVAKIDGTYYQFNDNGVEVGGFKPKSGWQQIDGKWYYGVDGELNSGYLIVGPVCYRFGENYQMLTNYINNDNSVIYDKNGLISKNKWAKIDGNWYNSNSLGRMYKDEIRVIAGKIYTFDEYGRML